jgi:nicotinate-nucleotide adenylyltransferase
LREVIASVEFIVVSRPGRAYQVLPVSSSEIRRQLAAGDDRVDVPPAVLAYIREHGLYR